MRYAFDQYRAEAIRLNEKGLSSVEIAKKYGVSRSTVTRAFKRWGQPVLRTPKKDRPPAIEYSALAPQRYAILRALRRGMSVDDIAAAVGAPHRVLVERTLTHWGINHERSLSADEQSALHLYEEGQPVDSISKATGIMEENVLALLADFGAKAERGYAVTTLQEAKNTILQAVEDGTSLRQIARDMDLSVTSVLAALQRWGIKPYPPLRKVSFRRPIQKAATPDAQTPVVQKADQPVLAAYISGMAVPSVAEKLGIPASRVRETLDRYGMERRHAQTRLAIEAYRTRYGHLL